ASSWQPYQPPSQIGLRVGDPSQVRSHAPRLVPFQTQYRTLALQLLDQLLLERHQRHGARAPVGQGHGPSRLSCAACAVRRSFQCATASLSSLMASVCCRDVATIDSAAAALRVTMSTSTERRSSFFAISWSLLSRRARNVRWYIHSSVRFDASNPP